MTKRRAMAFISGLMANNMTEHGKMVNSMVKQLSETPMDELAEAFGRTARENNGSKILRGKWKTLSWSPIIDHNINLVEKIKKSRKCFNLL